MTTSPVVALRDVTKTFGAVRALDAFDLTVDAGEVHGFLGPNGSGKSTTMRILLGLLRADSGTVRLLDGDPWHDAAALHRRLAYVPGDVALWSNLTGGETIDVLGRMRGGLDDRRRADLVERFELDPTRRARTYSKGNRQKVALVAAFAAPAELYLLDEPTSGLDPLMEAEFQRCVREVVEEGATVLLSSHILAEVEALCDRLTIVRAGHAVQTGTLGELRRRTRTTVTAETVEPPDRLGAIAGVHDLRVEPGASGGHEIALEAEPDALDAVVGALGGLGLRALTAHPPTLQDLFLREYGDRLSDEEEG